jgi:hypothetical protein
MVNSQARTINRIGAPTDFLYRFDLTSEDRSRFRLFLMVNTFFLTRDEGKASELFRERGDGGLVLRPGLHWQAFEPSRMEG